MCCIDDFCIRWSSLPGWYRNVDLRRKASICRIIEVHINAAFNAWNRSRACILPVWICTCISRSWIILCQPDWISAGDRRCIHIVGKHWLVCIQHWCIDSCCHVAAECQTDIRCLFPCQVRRSQSASGWRIAGILKVHCNWKINWDAICMKIVDRILCFLCGFLLCDRLREEINSYLDACRLRTFQVLQCTGIMV